MARAKKGFSADVSHLARTGRYGADLSSLGSSLSRNLAGTTLAVSGSLAARPLAFSLTPGESPCRAACRGRSVLTLVKNAAMPQYSVCFHFVKGWLWHWAHWSCTPRKSRLTESVTLSAVGLARK